MEKRTMLASATSVLLVVAAGSAAIGVSMGTRAARDEADIIGALQPVATEVAPYPERDPSDPPLRTFEFRTVEEVVEVGEAARPAVAGGLTAARASSIALEHVGGGTVETVTVVRSTTGVTYYRVHLIDPDGRTVDVLVDAKDGSIGAVNVLSGTDDDDDEYDDDEYDDDEYDDDEYDDEYDDEPHDD